MSQQSLDLVLAFTVAYNARDIDAAVGLCAADIRAFPMRPLEPLG